MLLVCDIGNTNTVLGAFEGQRLVDHWRVSTARKRTVEEWALLVRQLMSMSGLASEAVSCAAMASVVPPLTPTVVGALERTAGVTPLVVGPGVKTGMPILYENPKEVGADRIVNAVAAYERYRQALIIVDLGTATTVDCVTERGEYLGGAIAPGIAISMDALFHAAAKLPRVDFARPRNVIGRNTVESIQSGVLFGYVSLVDGLVRRLADEMGCDVTVIATGGLAGVIATKSEVIDLVEPHLTLEGLRLIFEKNQV